MMRSGTIAMAVALLTAAALKKHYWWQRTGYRRGWQGRGYGCGCQPRCGRCPYR